MSAPGYDLVFVVARLVKQGEHDAMLALLAEDGSKVSAYARRLRGSKSRFPAGLELFCSYRGQVVPRRSGVVLLTQAQPIQPLHRITHSLHCLGVASCGLELVRELACEERESSLYALLWTFLAELDARADEPAPLALLALRWLELRVLAEEGLLPDLFACMDCGLPLTGDAHHSLARAGLLCPSCVEVEAQTKDGAWTEGLRGAGNAPVDAMLLRALQRLHSEPSLSGILRSAHNKLGGQAQRPMDKKLGGQAQRPMDTKLGEQRSIDKKLQVGEPSAQADRLHSFARGHRPLDSSNSFGMSRGCVPLAHFRLLRFDVQAGLFLQRCMQALPIERLRSYGFLASVFDSELRRPVEDE
ncbi:MAG: DNA repair protein RecO [Myxococcota bacterium]|nr:DNA repair protein RecO [Myxococcota bacterium]